jgi:hypothetical protein
MHHPLDDWTVPPRHKPRERVRARTEEAHFPPLAEWKEIEGGAINSLHRQSVEVTRVNFYEVAAVVAYSVVSLLLFAAALVSIATYEGSFALVLFVGSVATAMLAAGRAIEIRWKLQQ